MELIALTVTEVLSSLLVVPSMETTVQGSGFMTVVRWPKRGTAAAAPTPLTPARKPEKVPAVLVHLKKRLSYLDNVIAVKTVIDPASFGASIRKICRTMDGYSFIEYRKSLLVHAAAGRLSAEIGQKINDQVGTVFQLGGLVEAEVVDIDPIASKDDVFKALRDAIPPTTLDAKAEAILLRACGLWEQIRRLPQCGCMYVCLKGL